MSQEYTVKSWQAWEDEDGPVRDKFGNYKGSVTFDEYNSEPVDATFKTTPNVGDKKYGDITEYKTKAGKTRLKFQRADRPQEQSGKGNYQPRDDEAIKAQFAIKTAVEAVPKDGAGNYYERVEMAAVKFYAMVDRVKASKPTLAPQEPQTVQTMTEEEWNSLAHNA